MLRVRNFLSDESGVTAIEYALIASLIAVFIIVAVQAVGTQVSSVFNETSTTLKYARRSPPAAACRLARTIKFTGNDAQKADLSAAVTTLSAAVAEAKKALYRTLADN